MKITQILLMGSIVILGLGCSAGKVVLDSNPPKMPNWVEDSKVSWEEGETIFFKSSQTLRGTARPSACLQMAKMDLQETLLTEIQGSLRGSIEEASSSIDEDAEIILSKVRSTKFDGQIKGLRVGESYWEKYTLGKEDAATLTCYMLGTMTKKDYNATKKAVLQKIIAIDPRLKEAIMQNQEAFLKERDASK